MLASVEVRLKELQPPKIPSPQDLAPLGISATSARSPFSIHTSIGADLYGSADLPHPPTHRNELNLDSLAILETRLDAPGLVALQLFLLCEGVWGKVWKCVPGLVAPSFLLLCGWMRSMFTLEDHPDVKP